MNDAKAEILARIRAVDRLPAVEGGSRAYRRAGALGRGERVELFCERVAEYRADVQRLRPDEIGSAIGTVCAGLRIGVPAGLPPEWRPASVDLVDDPGFTPHELDALDGVLTGCTVAIAETGTIVLTGGGAEGRRALSLVPDLHVCVVRSTQIVELVPEAFALLDDLVAKERRPLTFVSGPSATSDIELSRVEGVHGPRTLVVLVSEEEE